jgi:hypothetical protein
LKFIDHYKDLLALELLITNLIIQISVSDIKLRKREKIDPIKKKIQNLVSRLKLKGITTRQIAELYYNRHEHFINGKWAVSKSDKVKANVSGVNSKPCEWPDCKFSGNTDLDHTLPQSSYSSALDHLFQDNTTNFCPFHNRLIKRDNIMLGLYFRKFISF